MGINEEDLPDFYFSDDHPTRGSKSRMMLKDNQKKILLIVMGVVAVYVWHRRQQKQQQQQRTPQHQYNYIGKGMRVGSTGESEGIGGHLGIFQGRTTSSELEEKKLESARCC